MADMTFGYLVQWKDKSGDRMFVSKESLTAIRKKCIGIAKKQSKGMGSTVVFKISKKSIKYSATLSCVVSYSGKVESYFTSSATAGEKKVSPNGTLRPTSHADCVEVPWGGKERREMPWDYTRD